MPLDFLDRLAHVSGRRTFLQWTGLTIGVVALGCSDDDDDDGGLALERRWTWGPATSAS